LKICDRKTVAIGQDSGKWREQMQLRAEAGRLKERIEVLEQENRRLSEANEAVKRDMGQFSDCCPKVKKDLTNLEQELAKLKEEMRATNPKAEPLAPPTANVAVPRATPAPKPAPMKVLPPSAPPKRGKQFPPSLKKVKTKSVLHWQSGKEIEIDVAGGIIAHLTRECGGNVHDRRVVDITSGSFEKVTVRANPHSGVYKNKDKYAAKNAADLETDSIFQSAYRYCSEEIPDTPNNWICYDFKERRIVPTHYAIQTNYLDAVWQHLKSWLVETSADGESWREVAREENNEQLNGFRFTGTFAVAGGGECRFIRLVNIGRNHRGSDQLAISAWEIFGSLFE
jgi:hypothetical protein